jgi:hypothetical protein
MSTHTQSRFAAALLDRVKETPPGLVSWSGARPVKRFGVYRNNVSTGLVQALAVRFPATEAIVGKEFFAAMAGAFVLQDPPRSPILLHYGSEFARYVEGFAPAAELSYLADVVRLENARAEAYHAADIAPLPPGALASIGGDRLEDLKLVFHPSFAVIRSLYPRPIEKWSGEDALVVRPQLSVLTRRLPPGGAIFLEALAKGQSLNSANERAQVAAAEFDLTANLAGIFQSGLVVAVSATPPVEG